MAGFYAAKLGIFKEVETEPDPNAQAATQAEPAAQGEQPATQDSGAAEQQSDAQSQEQSQENPEATKNPEQQSQSEEDPTADTIPNDDPNAGDAAQPPQGGSGGDQGSTSAVDDIKKKEEEIYADLTPEELDIKHKELKTQYLTMFDMTTELVQRINNISPDPDYIPTIEYVSNNLARLRTMLVDYMESVYKTKSYTENYINYNRFIATLNGISKILEEINKNED